ncbi:MAG: AEC family transporter [Thermodesulfatator sp.]|nr:MAG: AEC family transporter [Thermodesulfatator sp.]
MENFIITIFYLFLGIFFRRLGKFPESFANSLNLFVIYISLPALVLLKIPEMALGSELFFVALLPWIMVLVSAGAVLAISKMLNWPKPLTGCLLLMIPLGNTSFLGIPMVKAFFGDAAISYAVIYDQLGSFLALATYGTFILAIYGKTGKTAPGVREIITKIATFPPFIALVTAFLVRDLDYPHVARQILESLGGTLVPLVMIAVGYQLRLKVEPGGLVPLSVGLGLKLVFAPLSALLLVRLLGLDGQPAQVAVFEAGMPPMVSAGALAILTDLAPRLTAALVGLGIFLSFLTLPVMYKLIELVIG